MSTNESKVALVTGGSSGIGEATAKLFATKGYRVAITGSNPDKVNKVLDEITKLGKDRPLGLVLDFFQPENGKKAVEETVKHFGRLDVLVNNAAFIKRTPLSEPESYQTYRDLMTVNTDATVSASLAAAGHLKQSKGNMIFVSSILASREVGNLFGYSASKAAMAMVGKALSVDLAPDVRVNVVTPGPIKTSMLERSGVSQEAMQRMQAAHATLLGRMGESSEVASLIHYIVSDEAAFINGQEIVIDGGRPAHTFS